MRSLDSSRFHRPMAVDDSRKHPNPLGKLLWMERKLCSWRSGESSFKIELLVHHWRWSLNQRSQKWDIQRLKISAVFPDIIGMTSCAELNGIVFSIETMLSKWHELPWRQMRSFQHGNCLSKKTIHSFELGRLDLPRGRIITITSINGVGNKTDFRNLWSNPGSWQDAPPVGVSLALLFWICCH